MSLKTVVVDASLAIKWILDEPRSREARELLADWTEAEVGMLAPELLAWEIGRALYERIIRGELSIPEGREALQAVLETGPELISDISSYGRALQLASMLAQTSLNEACYLALAEHENCECWTADERLWRNVSDSMPWVKWIGAQPETEQV